MGAAKRVEWESVTAAIAARKVRRGRSVMV
jgi:hypothetical protein